MVVWYGWIELSRVHQCDSLRGVEVEIEDFLNPEVDVCNVTIRFQER
jgi:hypothetical protein